MNLNNFYYRVDNLRPNSLVVKGVVKKAGSGLATPMMTAEQKEWWKKTVEKKTSGTSNVKEVLSPKDKAIADLMNWYVQNVPQKQLGKCLQNALKLHLLITSKLLSIKNSSMK